MWMFWSAIGVLLVVALLLLAWPWLKASRGKGSSAQTLNVQLTRQRLQELKTELEQGLLTESAFEKAEEEIKLALVNEHQPESGGVTSMPKFWFVPGIIILLVALALYAVTNQYPQLQQRQNALSQLAELGKRVVLDADNSVTPQELETMALGLRLKLQQQPEDNIGWLLLGRVQMSLQQLEDALLAFEKALALAPTHPGVMFSYSQALLMTGLDDNIAKAIGLLGVVAELRPDDSSSLGLLAVAATQQGDTALALSSWQKMQQLLSADDPRYASVTEQIRTLKGETTGGARIDVEVDISEALASKIPSSGYLFVFAQDGSGGSRVPAAVKRIALGQWPVKIQLSDADAMLPSLTLSSLQQVKLVARISLDENVATAAGELQGQSLFEFSDKTWSGEIVIDQEIQL